MTEKRMNPLVRVYCYRGSRWAGRRPEIVVVLFPEPYRGGRCTLSVTWASAPIWHWLRMLLIHRFALAWREGQYVVIGVGPVRLTVWPCPLRVK